MMEHAQEALVYASYMHLGRGCGVARRHKSPDPGSSYCVLTSDCGSAEHRQQASSAFLACGKVKEVQTAASLSCGRSVALCFWQVKSLIAVIQQRSPPGFTLISPLPNGTVCQKDPATLNTLSCSKRLDQWVLLGQLPDTG